MRSFLIGLVCACLCLTGTAAQQTEAPSREPSVTFKAEIDYVDIDTIVTDRQGTFVSGLTRDDFEVFEDGKPQNIDMFSFVDLPIDHFDRRIFDGHPVPADVKSNQQSLAGRLYVILLDDLDTSFFRSGTVRRSARTFIEQHFGANDVGTVVYTSGRSDASQEFTGDPSLLLAANDKFVGRKLRSAVLDKIDAQYNVKENEALTAASTGDTDSPAALTNNSALSPGSSTDRGINPFTRGDGYPDRTFDTDDLERAYRAERVLGELKDLSDFMGNIHGRRKALLLFSEGIDYDTSDIYGTQDASLVTKATQDAITAAARGNVSIFGIDPRGLVGMSADAVSLDSAGPPGDGPTSTANLAGFGAEMRLSQDSLRSLSEETGGFAVLDNDPSRSFDRIVRENSTYYVLGYYPPSHPRAGRFHKIEVRVKRPGVTVVARKGYSDARRKTPEERDADERQRLAKRAKPGVIDTTSPPLRDVLNSPMQQGGVTLAVQAAPFRQTDKQASVALTIETAGSDLQFTRQNNGTVFADKLELSYFPINETGKPLEGQRREFELALRPDTYEHVRNAGLRFNERIALAPGRYQLRIGMREAGTEALGTVFFDVSVPDFGSDPISMSGMLLTAAASAHAPTLVSDKLLAPEQLPWPATSRRTFSQGDTLAVYAEVYDNVSAKQLHSLDIVTSLIGEDGRPVFTSRENHDGAALRSQGSGQAGVVGISNRIALRDVPPGQYLLRLDARVRGHSKDAAPATRETLLSVVSAASK
jgi:VWFA-related protein